MKKKTLTKAYVPDLTSSDYEKVREGYIGERVEQQQALGIGLSSGSKKCKFFKKNVSFITFRYALHVL